MPYPYKIIIRIRRMLLGEVEHDVKVTAMGSKKFHCRIYVNDELNQEAVCFNRSDIGVTCRNMLRMEDKCGNISAFASAARERLNRGE